MFQAYLAAALLAAQQAATPAPTGAKDQTAVSDVVVQAARPEAVARIDRNVYDIKNDPQAKGAPLLDILGKLPSVSVTPAGRLQLLGSSGVTVMLDGKPVSPDKLGAMSGTDVDKVEVMTNPSAQYAAQGSAGIINIVTRKRYSAGWTGAVTARAENDGDVELLLNPTLALGKWSIGGSLTASRLAQEAATRRTRILTTGGASQETRTEDGQLDMGGERLFGDLKLTYRPTDRQVLTLTGEFFANDWDRDGTRSFDSDAPTFADYVERQDGDWRFRAAGVGASYEWTGSREGETLKLEGSRDRSRFRMANAYENAFATGSRRFTALDDSLTHLTEVKVDYARPFGAKQLLSTGATWSRSDEDLKTGFSNPGADPGLVASFDRRLDGRRDLAAAYATFQFPLGPWTALPGLRVEADDFSVTAAGRKVERRATDLFPSLHLSRSLAKDLGVRISYSRRIQRPDASRLDPSVNYDGSTKGSAGNPDLKAATTDAYEARLDYKLKGHGLNLTFYDRRQQGVWSTVTTFTPEGVALSTTVNGGRAVDRGSEISARGSLGARWKYVATLNLYQRESLILDDGRTRSLTRTNYAGNGQLDYRAPAKGEREGDQWQLALRYFGPERALQNQYSDYFRADLTWRRALTRKVSAVLVITDLLDSAYSKGRNIGSNAVEISTTREPAPRARLSLTYKLGGGS